MTSLPSDSESNVSGFIRYNNDHVKYLYRSLIENMQLINQDVLEIERNLKNILKRAGPLESQLATLLQTFPKPNITLPMETE